MLQTRTTVIEQVRRLALPLNTDDRLALIRAIASLETPKREPGIAPANGRTLEVEQEAWFARPAAERERYMGEYIAIHRGEVMDHDPDQRTLYLRVRERFGRQPVLIVKADWSAMPDFTLHSPRLER
jgi:hypothetical protein